MNVGSFSEVTRVAAGRYRSTYVPPPTRFPQVALVAVWRETGPEARIEYLRISLYVTTKIPVASKAGSQVTLQIGPDSFGPVMTDARGKATIAAAVPPNVHDAMLVVKDKQGLETKKKIPIEVPTYNRMTIALVPHAIVAVYSPTAAAGRLKGNISARNCAASLCPLYLPRLCRACLRASNCAMDVLPASGGPPIHRTCASARLRSVSPDSTVLSSRLPPSLHAPGFWPPL